jgi:nicotinamidase-related amidase
MESALLAIDFINDIVHPDGKIAGSAAHVQEQGVIAHANEALTHARDAGWLIVLVRVGFEKNYRAQPRDSPVFGQANRIGALALGEFGTEFHEELDVRPTDFILEKPRISPFYGTPLEVVLRSNGIGHLYLCGVSSSWAIQAAARDAHDRDYRVTIIEDACAAASREEHEVSMRMLARIARVITAKEMEAE